MIEWSSARKLTPLRSIADYEAAVSEIDRLLDADPVWESAEYERLESLSVLVEAYENEHYPFDDVLGTPQNVVEFTLEQRGMTRDDLYRIMGGERRATRFLSGKQALSADEARCLHKRLRIPVELLVG
jgi:HTH-type transcriptional regulator/antitoxin HigA